MSKESEKAYKKMVRLAKSNGITYTPPGGGAMDAHIGMNTQGPSLRDFRRELEACAQRDKNAGGKCGLMYQIRKRKK